MYLQKDTNYEWEEAMVAADGNAIAAFFKGGICL
jgi:hypothetical protein